LQAFVVGYAMAWHRAERRMAVSHAWWWRRIPIPDELRFARIAV
jgi:hypothetical protein